MDFVLKGNVIYSKTKKKIAAVENGYAVCVDGRSAGVFSVLPEKFRNLPIVDHGDCIIIPGFTDLHLHAPQFAFCGYGMDHELMTWLNLQTFPEESKYSDIEYADKAYEIFTETLKKTATVRACVFATVHRDATMLLMEKLEKSGIVSYVGKVNMDRGAPETLKEESFDISAYNTFGWINSVEKKNFKRTFPILTPRFVPSCTDELMKELIEVQRAYDLPVQSHLSESKGEIELVRQLYPDNSFYGDVYNDYSMFGRNEITNTDVKTVMAHCVWSTDEEVELIKKNGVFVAHCPASNMNLSSGIAPIRKYLDLDVKVGLGSDVASGHSLSLLRAVTDAVQVSKMYMRYIDESKPPVTFPEAFYMATLGGGEFFGKAGSFEEGYEFDAVVLDDSAIRSVEKPALEQRFERAAYMENCVKIKEKYVQGVKLF